MAEINQKIIQEISNYYSGKINEYGPIPQGVDWNGFDGQKLRFQQLLQVIISKSNFKINDLGCGYGALVDHLEEIYKDYQYFGVDISAEMIGAAKKRFKNIHHLNFNLQTGISNLADYTVASGIFNVKLENDNEIWWGYIVDTLNLMASKSIKGFSFNCLTSYSEESKKKDYLYYANPGKLFDFCKTNYSKNVALLHDYDLYEFTIIVRY
jgi:SAM-dependent methyltransferase